MTYVDGLVIPVKAGNDIAAYRRVVQSITPIFREYGATRFV